MNEKKFVVFQLEGERYGLPIERTERILPTQAVTRIPKTPKAFLGIFELRGVTIPALDARVRFGLKESGEGKNFIVVSTPEGRCAIRVDQVEGISEFQEEQMETADKVIGEKDFLAGIGKHGDKLTVLLDPDALVPHELRKTVAKAAA